MTTRVDKTDASRPVHEIRLWGTGTLIDVSGLQLRIKRLRDALPPNNLLSLDIASHRVLRPSNSDDDDSREGVKDKKRGRVWTWMCLRWAASESQRLASLLEEKTVLPDSRSVQPSTRFSDVLASLSVHLSGVKIGICVNDGRSDGVSQQPIRLRVNFDSFSAAWTQCLRLESEATNCHVTLDSERGILDARVFAETISFNYGLTDYLHRAVLVHGG